MKSKKPAVLADRTKAKKKNIAAYIYVAGFFSQYFNSCKNIVENIMCFYRLKITLNMI